MRASWRPSAYSYELGGCRVGIEFPIAKLIDYEARWQELDQSQNPFVAIIMAHLKTKATTGQPQQRKQLLNRLERRSSSHFSVVLGWGSWGSRNPEFSVDSHEG